jgi:hypothetical protein
MFNIDSVDQLIVKSPVVGVFLSEVSVRSDGETETRPWGILTGFGDPKAGYPGGSSA